MKLDLLHYNEYTQSIKHWNPYIQEYDPILFNDSEVYILCNMDSDNSEYLLLFSIERPRQDIITIKSIHPYIAIYIEINSKEEYGKTNYMRASEDYERVKVLKWICMIMKKMGCKECVMNDNGIMYNNNNTHIPISFMDKLWRVHTYYEEFGFIPYDDNKNNLSSIIYPKIRRLQEKKWDEYKISDPKYNEFRQKYSYIYPSPYSAFHEFSPDKCNLFYDILYLLECEELSEIKRLISRSVWVKVL